MKYAFFSVILAVMVLPVDPIFGPDEISAGPCNPEVQDCP